MATFSDHNSSVMASNEMMLQNEMRSYVKRVLPIFRYFQTAIFISGLLGNLLALIVINRKSLRSTSSAVFITYMALFDTGVLFVYTGFLYRPRPNLFIHCSLTYLQDLFIFCANWILVIVTLERCLAVSSPFLAKRFCTAQSARYSVLALVTCGVMIWSIYFPIVYFTDSDTKKCYIRSNYGDFHRVFQFIIFYGLPYVFLLSNFFTIFTLIQRRRRQERLSTNNGSATIEMRVNDVHSNRKQKQLTLMLVTVNLIFYSCSIPAIISFFTEHQQVEDQTIRDKKVSFLLHQGTVIFLQIPNATNFIFYCLAGERFRQTTVETFQFCVDYLRFFFRRYILGNKQYELPSRSQRKHNPSSNSSPSKRVPRARARTATF